MVAGAPEATAGRINNRGGGNGARHPLQRPSKVLSDKPHLLMLTEAVFDAGAQRLRALQHIESLIKKRVDALVVIRVLGFSEMMPSATHQS